MDFRNLRQGLLGDAGNRAMHDARECQMATAAELMFFNGAPLAHVVAYREHLRMESIACRNTELSRSMRRLRSGLRAPVPMEWGSAR